jgi:diaminopimelate decarboxylase
MNSLSSLPLGAFNFNSNSELCIGDVNLSEFISKYLSNTQQDESRNNDKKPLFNTPLFLYSKNKILANFYAYKDSFSNFLSSPQSQQNNNIQTHISYSLKANYNPSILKIFQENGSWCSLVNKNELILALRCGFHGERLIFNGNGKTLEEIELAIKAKCYLNIDSLFNLKHTIKVCQKLFNNGGVELLPAKIVIRINQLINAKVHQYLSTSVHTCKFGIIADSTSTSSSSSHDQLDTIIEIINANKHLVKLVGFHTHLGSTIKDMKLYDESVKNLIDIMKLTREKFNTDTIDLINFGGGLGIDYEKFAHRTMKESDRLKNDDEAVMTVGPKDLAKVISKYADDLKNMKIVVEPGRLVCF